MQFVRAGMDDTLPPAVNGHFRAIWACFGGSRKAGLTNTGIAMRYSAYGFDAYGTLFYVHAAVRRHADAIGPDGQLLSEIWRAKQLEYSWVRSLMGAYADFWQLTEQALDFAFRKVPTADPQRPALQDRPRRL